MNKYDHRFRHVRIVNIPVNDPLTVRYNPDKKETGSLLTYIVAKLC